MQPSHTHSGISLVDVALGCCFKGSAQLRGGRRDTAGAENVVFAARTTFIHAHVNAQELDQVLPERDGVILVRNFTERLRASKSNLDGNSSSERHSAGEISDLYRGDAGAANGAMLREPGSFLRLRNWHWCREHWASRCAAPAAPGAPQCRARAGRRGCGGRTRTRTLDPLIKSWLLELRLGLFHQRAYPNDPALPCAQPESRASDKKTAATPEIVPA